MSTPPDPTGKVGAAFDSFPHEVRGCLLELRDLVFSTAQVTEGVGDLEETLKWGEPAYLTPHTKSGSTIRLAAVRGSTSEYGLFFNCQTTLVETFRQWFPELRFDGNRAVLFDVGEPIDRDAAARCISAALTYHLDKRRARGS